MPYLRIKTTSTESTRQSSPGGSGSGSTETFLKKASRLVAQELGKPEGYVMVSLDTSGAMLFAGSTGPTAFLELRAIGLPTGKTSDLSRVLCDLVVAELGVPKARIFINFVDVPPPLWGWNGDTF